MLSLFCPCGTKVTSQKTEQARNPKLFKGKTVGWGTFRKPRSWHLELREVSCRFPVLIIPNSGAARKSDGDPISSVSLRFGEFCSRDLPHSSFLSGMKQEDYLWPRRKSSAARKMANGEKSTDVPRRHVSQFCLPLKPAWARSFYNRSLDKWMGVCFPSTKESLQ